MAGPYVRMVKNRTLKVKGVTYDNDDGTSRQEILEDIKLRRDPFRRGLHLSLEEYDYEGRPAYHVKVNGYIIGTVPSELSPFITENRDNIIGLRDLEVSSFRDRDTGETVYYARATLAVSMDECGCESDVFDDDYEDNETDDNITLFLDEKAISSLNYQAFMDYARRVQDTAQRVLNDRNADPDYVQSLTDELRLIQLESSARTKRIQSKAPQKEPDTMSPAEKEKIARLRWPSLVFSVVLLACISVLIFLDASVGVVFAGSGISVAVIVFTMWAFKLAGDLREEKSAQQAPPKSAKEKQVDEAINTRWFFAVLGVGLMVIAVLGSVAHMPIFLSVYTFLCSLFSLAYALYGFFKHWDRNEQEEEE